MGTEASESSVSSPTKKRRFPIPFRKKQPKQQPPSGAGAAAPSTKNGDHRPAKPPSVRGIDPSNLSSSTAAATTTTKEKDSIRSPLRVNFAEPPKPSSNHQLPPPSSSSSNNTAVTNNTSSATKMSSSNPRAQPPEPAASPRLSTIRKLPVRVSWLARTKFFRQMCDWAFTVVDQDGSGTVDEKELYSGLLLIHLKLGSYAGPAACKPLELGKVRSIFAKYDKDGSGSLNKEEFREVMMVLFGNVLFRVLVQWTMTLMIVPLVAQYALNGAFSLWDSSIRFINSWDDNRSSSVVNNLALMVEEVRDTLWETTPHIIQSVVDMISVWLNAVPNGVWNSLPLTLVSCILGIMVVPYMIFKVDDFFQKLAIVETTPPPPSRHSNNNSSSNNTSSNNTSSNNTSSNNKKKQ